MPVKVNPLTMSQTHNKDYLEGWNDCHKMMAEEIVRQDTQIDQYDLTIHGLTTKNDELREAGRKSADEAAAALGLLSRVRFALGDNGKRMQDELLVYCAELRDAKTRIQQALGNGVDEIAWPPGTTWIEAACRIIRESGALAALDEDFQRAKAERDRYANALEQIIAGPYAGGFGSAVDVAAEALDH